MPIYHWVASAGDHTVSLADIERAKQSHHPAAQFLWLVPEQVGYFLDKEGLFSDLANELISVGTRALVEALRKKPKDTEFPEAYLRKCIKNALSDRVATDGLMRRSARTERRRRKSGKKVVQYQLDHLLVHNHDAVCDLVTHNGGSRAEAEELAARLTAPTDDEVARLTADDDQLEIVECYRKMYSLCRDDHDRAVLETRWEGGICLVRPPHVETIAETTGLSVRAVRKILTRICRRYCHDLDLRMPKGRIVDGVK